jgi:hypothetical protein
LNFELKEDTVDEKSMLMPDSINFMSVQARGPPPPPQAPMRSAAPQKHRKRMAKKMVKQEAKQSEEMQEDENDFAEECMPQMEAKPYYEKLDATKEYAETHYFGITDINTFRTLVPISEFYAELARAFLNGSNDILSESFLQCTRNQTDSYAALAFSALPFRAARHGFESQERGYVLTANSNFLVFHKVLEAVQPDFTDALLVAQKYFDPSDRMCLEDGQQVEKPVKQFLKDKFYGCQVILSNTSSKTFNVDVVAEIPEGAVPLVQLDYSFVKSLTVASYSTTSFEFFFYFPLSGSYRHFPANVSVKGVVKAVARSQTLAVTDTPSLDNLESFQDIVSSGNADLIMRHLADKNLFSSDIKLDSVLWLARDPEQYTCLLSIYRNKRVFHPSLWAFSVVHNDLETFSELLQSRHDILKSLSLNYTSKLLPAPRNYRHLDYFPLVNARAHKLGTKTMITNTKFKTVYRQFLIQLAEKPSLDSYDYIALAHYWVLQDRLSEAKSILDSHLADCSSLQLDYIRAYLDLPHAADIAKRYSAYPVKAWRDLFGQVSSQLVEAQEASEYREAHRIDEPNLSFTVEVGGVVKLEHTGLSEAWLSVYEVDLEVLFCRNPFFSHGNQDFSFVTPNFKSKLGLDPEARRTSVTLPKQYQSKNVMVEVEYNGNRRAVSYFATSLKVQVLELYGQLKVTSSEFRALPLTYVKAFARFKSGETKFYKDGYTDIRGRFDFVSLNTDLLKQVDRFALFVEHEKFGSLTVEASPPPQ